MKDYYKILNISKTATFNEIKIAYRTKALQYHPDRNKDPNSAKLFIEINEAYQILIDPQKRGIYNSLFAQYNTIPEFEYLKFKSESTYVKYVEWVEIIRNNALMELARISDNSLTEIFHFIHKYGWYFILAFFLVLLLLSQSIK